MNLRLTPQRQAVITALAATDEFVSAQALHDALADAPGKRIGLATVYRTLATLAEAGEVDVRQTPDGEAQYRRCAQRAHHHHLVCRACGKAIELDAPTVEHWADTVAAQHGFTDIGHTVELTGTCAACR